MCKACRTVQQDCLILCCLGRELIVPLAGARLGLSVSAVAVATAVGFVVDSVFRLAAVAVAAAVVDVDSQ